MSEQRVRALHVREYAGHGLDHGQREGAFCLHCSDLQQDYVQWPCPTIRALDMPIERDSPNQINGMVQQMLARAPHCPVCGSLAMARLPELSGESVRDRYAVEIEWVCTHGVSPEPLPMWHGKD
jgi:hypothetical protein